MQTDQYIETYFSDLKRLINSLPRETIRCVFEKLDECRNNEKTLFVFGNGGSAATAQHMVCDMGKNTRGSEKPRMRVVGLSDNMAILSAYANDEGYHCVFAEQIISLGRAGDIVLAISGSGNSPNVLEGVKAAKARGLYTIGLTGFAGGKLKEMVDLALVVPVQDMEQAEDAHMILDHVITGLLRGARYNA